jgi:predicted enzyme related to lactoylglutathione lyase
VEAAGGTILKAKTIISEEQNLGYWALMKDTEGNRVALHSMG